MSGNEVYSDLPYGYWDIAEMAREFWAFSTVHSHYPEALSVCQRFMELLLEER